MNLANVFLRPSREFAIVVLANVGGAKATHDLRNLPTGLYRRYDPAPAR